MTAPLGTTTVPAAKAYLFTLLSAQLAGDGRTSLKVFYDDPGTDILDDIIVVGKMANRVSKPYTMRGSMTGRGSMWETYDLEVVVSCYRGGDQPQHVYERAWLLATQIESAVRADPSLGGLVTLAFPAHSSDDPKEESEQMGRLVDITLGITIESDF